MMKCWKMNLRPGNYSWWAPTAYRVGRSVSGYGSCASSMDPTLPIHCPCSRALPESVLAKMGKIYHGKPMRVKSRKELIETIKPQQLQYLRPDNGDLPGWHLRYRCRL